MSLGRNDRPRGRSVGVGIYTSEDIQHRIISIDSHYGECEMVFNELNRNGRAALSDFVYLPRGQIFESMIGDIFERYNNIIIIIKNGLYDRVKPSRMRSLRGRLNISLRINMLSTHFQLCNNTRSFCIIAFLDIAPCVLEEDFTSFYNANDVSCLNLILKNFKSEMASPVPLSRFKIKSTKGTKLPEVLYARSLRAIAYEAYVKDPSSE